MKKRILLVAIALILVLACLVACGNDSATLDKINKLLDKDYSKVKVEVTTTMEGVELKGKYALTFDGDVTNVTFTYEELSDLSFEGANNGFKNTVSGTAVVQNGVVISSNQEVDLDTAKLNFAGLLFKSTYFKNETATGNRFKADVVSPQRFLGDNAFDGTNMHVDVIYDATSIVQIHLSYVSAKGAAVSITYIFSV